METVFVTGGSSMLGQHVLHEFVSRVHVLAVVHRRNLEILDAEVELLRGGLEECVRHPAALQTARIVLHMAAVTHADAPSEYLRVNTELTKRLLSVCSPRQHFVYVSTICAHPNGGAYGRSKWLAEEAIRGSGLEYTIIRPAEIYGSKGREGIDALIALACKTRILPDFRYHGSIKYAPISVDEAAHFIAEATVQRRRADQIYTLCAQRPCTASEMAQALRSSVGPLFVVPVPVMLLRAATALRLLVPFKRDQVDRLVMPKVYSGTVACRDYEFQARPFLDYLAERGKIIADADLGR
jgi:nucleoside-diphosphate-sugar epimerase